MFCKKHVYNFIILIITIFPCLYCSINPKEKKSSYKYDYFNILDKGPKTDLNYIFNEENIGAINKNNDKKNTVTHDYYSKIVDETFPAYQSLFFTDLETITPLYDQTIQCLFPIKKDISFNNDLYINDNFFTNKTKIKIIPVNLAKIFLKPLFNFCYNYFYDNWYYKICPFNKAIQTLSYLKLNPKTKKEEKEVNYLGYASNDTEEFNENEYFFSESPFKKEFFENKVYKLFNQSQIVGIFENIIKIYDSPDVQHEFKKIIEEKKENEILPDYLIYKNQFKKLEIDFEVNQIEKIENINKYRVDKNYNNLDEFKKANKSNIVTYTRIIKKSINKNVFLLEEPLPPIKSGIINTRIVVFPYYQEDYYNKEFFLEKNYLYCEHCNLLKCQTHTCYLTVSKSKETYYKVIDFIDEKLVMIDSKIERQITHGSKSALFMNDEFIFLFGEGKIKEIQKLKKSKPNDDDFIIIDEDDDSKNYYANDNNNDGNMRYVLKGQNLNLKQGDELLILINQIKYAELIIIKDIHNTKSYLLATVTRKIKTNQYELNINNINDSSYANLDNLPVDEIFFKIVKRSSIPKSNGIVQLINKSKNIFYHSNIDQQLFNMNQISQITMSRQNLNFSIPYQIFDLNTKNNQTVFHFVIKRISQWKEAYINICLSETETCTGNDIEIIIHSKKGILIHKPKLSAEKVIRDSVVFNANDIVNLFTEKIICDIILVNSTLYFNTIDFYEYSYIKVKYLFEKEQFDKIKYAIISPMKSNNIKIKGIYLTNVISMQLYKNIYFYDKQFLLDDKAVFMETFTNGDYCEVMKRPRHVKVFYMCDDTGINNLKVAKVYESKIKLCEYIYYVKSKLLCNPVNLMKNQVNTSFTKSLCYSDKKFEQS